MGRGGGNSLDGGVWMGGVDFIFLPLLSTWLHNLGGEVEADVLEQMGGGTAAMALTSKKVPTPPAATT